MRAIPCAALSALLTACTVGPDYKRPELDAPQAYRFAEAQAQETANTAWWTLFADRELDRLIGIALAENKDMRIASARVEEFYGRYGVQRGQQFPQAALGAQAGSQQSTRLGTPPIPAALSVRSDFYSIDLGVSFELDLWGRLRRASEAARADLLGVEENRRTVVLTLVSAVALSYVNLLDLDRQLEIARATVRARAESLKIFELRFAGGTISEIELQQLRSEYESALATIPFIEKQIAQQENNLSVLLGRNPGPIVRGGTLEKLALPAVPAGIPSQLLERRPDIRNAEQQLVAANARIGVAKAAYYPVISLTGLLGLASADLSNLFRSDARTWSFAGQLGQPIFTGGTLAGQVAASEAQQQQALFAYQKAIQTAFGEVENALIEQRKVREQVAAQMRQVEALARYAYLAALRYENGYTSYIEVLDSERSLFNAQLQLTQTQGQLYAASINLYKALGGGWVNEADKLTPPPTVDLSKNPPIFPLKMSRRIAIVEDEPAIRANYAEALRKHGFEVAAYAGRADALAAMKTRLPDLALIDIGLGGDVDGGFALCRELRALSATLPIIFLTARDSDFDIVAGLRLGADDYLTKDVSLPHLMARIAALFRRAELSGEPAAPSERLERGPLVLDLKRFSVTWKGALVSLTLTEFWMVHALAKFPEHVKNREQLMREANLVVDDGTITSHVKRIRRKFIAVDPAFDAIDTVYGIGYRWQP